MIPIGDDNPTRTFPYITVAILVANVLVYAVDALGTLGVIQANLSQYSMIPYSVLHNTRVEMVIQGGKIVGFEPTSGLNPQWVTVFTHMFMHGGLLHILSNMLYLWIFGNNIEDALGHFRFLVFYLICGVAAAMLHLLFNVDSKIPMVGASGAIAGVLGAYLLLYPGARIRVIIFLFLFVTTAAVPASIVLIIWFIGQFFSVIGGAMTEGPGVAYWAHIGGFVAGIVLIIILGGRRKLVPTRRPVYSYFRE